MSEQAPVSASGNSSRTLPRWFWFGAALLLFLVSSWIAFGQEPHPDAYRQANPMQWDWWRYPVEFNADRRLPWVGVDLNDVYALRGTGHVWVVGGGGLILHSADHGKSWTRQYLATLRDLRGAGPSSPPVLPTAADLSLPELAISDLHSVHFVDPDNGWVAGDNGALFSSMDGGRTWIRRGVGLGRVAHRAIFFLDPVEGWLQGDYEVPLYTVDRGNSWQRAEFSDHKVVSSEYLNTLQEPEIEPGCFIRKDTYRFCAVGTRREKRMARVLFARFDSSGQPLNVWRDTEGSPLNIGRDTEGSLWPGRFPLAGYSNKALHSISFSDPERGWIAGTQGVLLVTADGGQTWQRVTRPALGSAMAYRIWPAPWYFLSLALVALLLVPALRSPKPAVISESVADLLVSDRPISAGDADVFDFKSVALGLSRFLRNEKTVPPLTIAVTGEWGTGKSSLMNLLQADLKRYGFRPVWFNAWHHQKEEHLLASLLATVRAQAVPPWWRPEGMIFRLRLLRIRWERFWPLIAFLLIVFSFSLGYFRSHPGQLEAAWNSVKAIPSVVADPGNWLREKGSRASGPWLALLISGAGLVISLWRGIKGFGVNPASLLARDSARTRVSDLEKLTGFRHQFAAEFRDITQALNPRTMVVMVDDLDRCKPEMVLEVLESINFLVSSGDCYVVLGMARERVIRCVGLSFKDVASELLVTQMSPEEKEEKVDSEELARRRRIEFATQYLEKLINIEVPVPAPTYAQSRRLLQESAPREETPEKRRDRIRRASWQGMRKAFPVAAAVALLFAGYWIGASRIQKQKSPEPVRIASPVASPSQAPSTSSAGDMKQTGSAVPLKPAEMDEAEKASLPVFTAYVLLVVLVGLGIWRLTVPPGVVIRDSQEFEEALETWHPLVFTFRKTPRSIKRFLNRVRYLAMLQRGPEAEPSRWRQILAWLQGIFRRQRKGEEKEPDDKPPAIPEHALVALVAIEHSRPDWFQNDSFFRDPRMVPGGNSIPAKIQEAIRDTPLKSYRDAYLRISRGIQVR